MKKEESTLERSQWIFLFPKGFHPSFLQPSSVGQEHLLPSSHDSVSLGF